MLIRIILVFLIMYNFAVGDELIEKPFPEIVKILKQRVVRVENNRKQFIGSGFFINSNGVIMTCDHVLKEELLIRDSLSGIVLSRESKYLDSVYIRNFVKVSFDDGSEKWKEVLLSCDIIYTNSKLDMALLRVKNKIDYNRFPYNFLGKKEKLVEGQDVAICAFIPDEYERPLAFVAKGIISTLRDSTYTGFTKSYLDIVQLDLSISKGTSGGPIFSSNTGLVIAMQGQGFFDSKNPVYYTPYAIGYTMNQMIEKLDSLKIPYIVK